MKIIEVTVRLEVSDDANFYAFDKDGKPWGYTGKPEPGALSTWESKLCELRQMNMPNWKETLTEMKQND